jgi:putative transposase
MSRYRHAHAPGSTYFFTVNTYHRQRLLTHTDVIITLRSAFRTTRAQYPSASMRW